METKDKILELIKEAQAGVDNLSCVSRVHEGRISGFQSSLDAVNGDQSPITVALKHKLCSRINEENEKLSKVSWKIEAEKARISAFEETLKLLQKGDTGGTPKDLRPSSELARVRDLLRLAGKPMGLAEILASLGFPTDKKKLISLRGTLRGYAKVGRIFTKEEAADVFGLLEFKKE